ncbi:helix-turn-helix transcriptional regulator [Streptomyces sp. NPDC046465]|uniref:helix-turn-helix domain-containing protein n=1 Tax=Streptomyces sp. NPDC046465 TaxID=3155810 RepID=UPI003405E5D9
MASLAELLGELKARSGLSYGVLGERLHMSSSALHRYCSGDAVPAQFALAERFARVCGATREELVEVHRRWVLADAARGRRAEAGPAASALLTPAPETELKPEPEPEPESKAGPELGSETRVLSLFRKRRTLVLAAAVIAVVVAISSVVLAVNARGDGGKGKHGQGVDPAASSDPSASSSGRSGKGDGQDEPEGKGKSHGKESSPRAGMPGGGQGGNGGPSGLGSEGHENSGTSERLEGSEGSEGSGKGRQAPGASGGGGKGPASGGARHKGPGSPLAARTRPYADEFDADCVQSFLVNRRAGQVPKPPMPQDTPAWVGELGAVPARDQYLQVTLQGTGKAPVVLEKMNVRVQSRGAPPPWNTFHMKTHCGKPVETKSFTVDLDASAPRATPVAGQRGFPYKVSESDPLVFYITARAEKHDVRWDLELRWSSGGRHGTLRIDDQGKPFRTSGSAGRPAYRWGGYDGWLRGRY